ncbi:hypothetical protein AGMMS50256_33450 [Betaproteobacteria bacterium]|nr:hypothetical protein AGMMS50256_33450 [Betaproteobacteria bacterium]
MPVACIHKVDHSRNRFYVRTKTDKADAQLIAQFCHERAPEPWQAPSPNEQTLRALVLRLDALQTMHAQEGVSGSLKARYGF